MMLVDAVGTRPKAATPEDRLPLIEEDEESEELDNPDPARATIDEVTRRAMARVRQAEQALLSHVHAVESAATQRSELVIARAELDAELIRLQARRTAHALLAGASGPETEQTDRERRSFDELSRSLSRFAAVLDDVSISAEVEPTR